MAYTEVTGSGLARGVCRHLREHGFATLTEFMPISGLRVDVIALGPKGEIWIVECKSSRADFMTDHKWEGYLDWCDRFYWAVGHNFPVEILPEGCGLIISDEFDAEIQRDAPNDPLASARRRSLTLKFARTAALRLQQETDHLLPGTPGY